MNYVKQVKYGIVVLSAALLLSPFFVSADHHNTEMLEGKVRTLIQNKNAGNFDEFFDEFMVGSFGFGADSFLSEAFSEDVISAAKQSWKSNYEKGARTNLNPKHITVKELGNTAVTAYYVDGSEVDENGERETVLHRVTVVWTKVEDDWKIAHWHVSDFANSKN